MHRPKHGISCRKESVRPSIRPSCALCSNDWRYWHSSSCYDSPMSLPDPVKIWLTSVNCFFSRFRPKVTPPPVDLCAGGTQWQIACSRSVRYSTLGTRRPIGNHHCSFESRWYYRWPPPTTSLLPKWGSQIHCTPISSWRVLPAGEYDRRMMLPVAKLKVLHMMCYINLLTLLTYFGPCYC